MRLWSLVRSLLLIAAAAAGWAALLYLATHSAPK